MWNSHKKTEVNNCNGKTINYKVSNPYRDIKTNVKLNTDDFSLLRVDGGWQITEGDESSFHTDIFKVLEKYTALAIEEY